MRNRGVWRCLGARPEKRPIHAGCFSQRLARQRQYVLRSAVDCLLSSLEQRWQNGYQPSGTLIGRMVGCGKSRSTITVKFFSDIWPSCTTVSFHKL
jgi:hypothetical protein